jgi:signal transduction histidine kinase
MLMHTLAYAGFLFFQGLSFVFAAAFFIRTWSRQRRNSDYLLFGFATLGVAAHTLSLAFVYYDVVLGNFSQLNADIATVTAVVSLSLILHFGVRYAGLPGERRIMSLVYSGAMLVALLVVTDNLWAAVPEQFGTATLLGVPIVAVSMRLTGVGIAYIATVPLALGFLCYLFGRSLRAGRREGAVAFAGAVVLLLAGTNDAMSLCAGLYSSVSLAPLAYTVLIYGVSLVLVQRYGQASSDLQRSTAELRKRTEQLHHSVEKLERTQEELVKSEQLAAIGGLASVIAEEVRNPLLVVKDALRSLHGNDGSSEEARAPLGIIKNEMRHLDRMVNDLLHYARPIQLHKTQVDLQSVLRASGYVAEDISAIEVSVHCDGPYPTVMGDHNLLRQAFQCLTINAVQAMSGVGELDVKLERCEVRGAAGVAIVFVDAGEGMTDQQRERALAPFFTTRPGGTGLGLPICARIVEAHGGSMTVDSRVGEGTTVTLRLPIEPDDVLRQSSSWQRVSLA